MLLHSFLIVLNTTDLPVHLKMVKATNFMLYVFYRDFRKLKKKKVDGEVQHAVDYLDLGLKRENRTKDRHLGVLHRNIILYHCLVCLFLCTCLVLHNKS